MALGDRARWVPGRGELEHTRYGPGVREVEVAAGVLDCQPRIGRVVFDGQRADRCGSVHETG